MQTFTPRFAAYGALVTRLLFALAILVLLVYWRFHQPVLVFVVEWVGVIGLAIGYTYLYFRNTRYSANPGALTIRNALGATHTLAQHHLAKGVLVQNYVTSRSSDARSIPRLLILDDEGRAVLRWSGRAWTEAQMRDLVSALGIPLTDLPNRLGSGDIQRRYPRALGQWEAYPVLVGVVLIVGLIVLTIAVFTGLGHS